MAAADTEFRPGLEGVIAFETEIAEPDRDGGQLRYRGVDVEPLVGKVPYENVWGLLVDNDLESKMPEPEPHEPAGLTGNAPADLQAETARLSAIWKLGKLSEISDEQARADLARLSAEMMAIVARSARVADGHTDAVPDSVVSEGTTAAEKFLLRWRGEADPRHVKAIDTYWICTAEHGLNASTFTARIAPRRRRRSAASGSPDCSGGAPAYVKPMLEEVAKTGRRVAVRCHRQASWIHTASTGPRTRPDPRGLAGRRRIRSRSRRSSAGAPKALRERRGVISRRT
jgi:citrate synthase